MNVIAASVLEDNMTNMISSISILTIITVITIRDGHSYGLAERFRVQGLMRTGAGCVKAYSANLLQGGRTTTLRSSTLNLPLLSSKSGPPASPALFCSVQL